MQRATEPGRASASDPSTLVSRILGALRVPALGDNPGVLFEVRRVAMVPGWLQVALVVGLFLATALLTNLEYREKGTTFGFSGPAFNVLVCPIYEELIFRGWLLGRLTRWKSPLVGTGVSSLLFRLFHVRNIFWLEPATLLRQVLMTGAVIGPLLAYVRSDSVPSGLQCSCTTSTT